MQVVHERCCGLDVHEQTVTACVLITRDQHSVQNVVRTFRTMTADLLALGAWLGALGVMYVAMESTGDYWPPVLNILEKEREVCLVNAQPIRAVPGRKTDVRDAERIADLLRHGLLRPSGRKRRRRRKIKLSVRRTVPRDARSRTIQPRQCGES